MNIYERIKELRIKNGLSQEELARRVGYVGRSAISKVEAGSRDISQSMIEKYAEALGVTPTYLLFGDKKETPPPTLEVSEDERALIELFRAIPEDQKKLCLAMIRTALGK